MTHPHEKELSKLTRDARYLLSAVAVRERGHEMLEHALAGRLDYFDVDLGRMDAAAEIVAKLTRERFPTLDVPFHARWRHFGVGGVDRWGALVAARDWRDTKEMARAAFDLAIVSVLLDAGSGPGWTYCEGRTGQNLTRSEGLAVASFDLFCSGALSAHSDDPFRADAAELVTLSPATLACAFQVQIDNPLIGLESRTSLLNRLGDAVSLRPNLFRTSDGDIRPGGLFDTLLAGAKNHVVSASDVLSALLDGLGSIWPGRMAIEGVSLGDTWRHPLAGLGTATPGLVPFHKLSQWLAYSLLEPLQWAGLTVVDVDALTGLPEYRNGGFFIDTNVLHLRRPQDAAVRHAVGSAFIVEWRALTVALLDRLAPLVRTRLGVEANLFPLAKILEGGTWAAGRRLAFERRPDGSPPILVDSDGTVF